MKKTRSENLRVVEARDTTMFKCVRRWVFWYKRSRAWKHFINTELLIARMRNPANPPTEKELEAFMKEYDLGWDSHMIDSVPKRRTYFEAELG